MIIALDKRFSKQAKGVFEKYTFQVGVLVDKAHLAPKQKADLKSYAGGPVRATSRKPSGLTISEVSEKLRKETGVNFYSAPFKRTKGNKDILNFSKAFFQLCTGRGVKQRVENYLQAIVRNPILRGDYGKNSSQTAKIKGFNRLMIDTGQLFKNIRAQAKVQSVQK